MGKEFQNEDTIDLLELFGMLWQHIFQILICTVIGAAVAFGVTKFLMVPQYQSSAMMIVNTRQDANANVTSDQINSATKLVEPTALL